jgi:hypothetical protein
MRTRNTLQVARAGEIIYFLIFDEKLQESDLLGDLAVDGQAYLVI